MILFRAYRNRARLSRPPLHENVARRATIGRRERMAAAIRRKPAPRVSDAVPACRRR